MTKIDSSRTDWTWSVFPTVIFNRTLQHLALKHILSRSHSCPATLVNASQAQPSLTTRLPPPPSSGLTTGFSGSNMESVLYSFAFPSPGAQMMNRGQGRYIFLINWGCNRSRFLVVTASPIRAIQKDPMSGWCPYTAHPGMQDTWKIWPWLKLSVWTTVDHWKS